MRHWLVRVLLNVGALVVAGAIGVAGMMTTGSPLSFGFSVLIYFFVAWGLANHVTRGQWGVGLGAYVGPLFLTYVPLCMAGMVYLTAMEAASEIDPDAPTFAMGLPLVLESDPMLRVVGRGLGLAIFLVIPPLVAIVDRPPPGQAVEAPDSAEEPVIETSAPMAIAASASADEMPQTQPVDAPADLTPEPDPDPSPDPNQGETLEELLGLEPTRHG